MVVKNKLMSLQSDRYYSHHDFLLENYSKMATFYLQSVVGMAATLVLIWALTSSYW
jgi:hypothetical protein